MNSLRQYTQSGEVFPIQNLLEKIGISGGKKEDLLQRTPSSWPG